MGIGCVPKLRSRHSVSQHWTAFLPMCLPKTTWVSMCYDAASKLYSERVNQALSARRRPTRRIHRVNGAAKLWVESEGWSGAPFITAPSTEVRLPSHDHMYLEKFCAFKRRMNLGIQGQEKRERYGRHEHARQMPHRSYVQACSVSVGATVAERLARSPPTKANWVQSPAESPDFRKWESCRTMPLVVGSSRGSSVSPAPSFRRRSISLQSPSSAVKTSVFNISLRAAPYTRAGSEPATHGYGTLPFVRPRFTEGCDGCCLQPDQIECAKALRVHLEPRHFGAETAQAHHAVGY
ncbi:hypothetical protein PR048_006239 [Dryococelus australis]|uniref:Uncharacterized protein n=1 Tax=Dryococelus australis TaxID=614101 RepID=A0ABQ9IAF1_9NEOP|nr:hypothetical protein PR048_006239 [Dryococelus australis]